MTINIFDIAARPKAPAIAGATAEHRRRGKHLAAIHRMHLQNMNEIRVVIDEVEAGVASHASAAEAVADMDMMRSYRTFGGMCGQQCQILNSHHTIEDTSLFPILRARGDEGLRKVVDRLAAEHLVIHELLEEVWGEASALTRAPDEGTFRKLKEAFDRLDAAVRSHFGYEETELEEALGVYGVV